MMRPDLDAEMAAMWERIQTRKADAPAPPPSFQVTTVVTTLAQTAAPPPTDTLNLDYYAGDPVPNPDAQGL